MSHLAWTDHGLSMFAQIPGGGGAYIVPRSGEFYVQVQRPSWSTHTTARTVRAAQAWVRKYGCGDKPPTGQARKSPGRVAYWRHP